MNLDNQALDTGHLCVNYINENTLVLDTFKPTFHDFSQFIIPERSLIMNNKQKSNEKCNNKMYNKRREIIRTKEELIAELKRLSKIDRKYLNYSHLRKIKRNDLLYDAIKLFGGWRQAIIASGFRPIQKGWTKKEIILEIKKAVSELEYVPKSKEVIKLGYCGLSTAARRRFGCWTNALLVAGFKPFRTRWSREKALKELKKFTKERNNSSIKEFETKKEVIENIKPKSEKKTIEKKWNQKRVVEEILIVNKKLGYVPNIKDLKKLRRGDLVSAIRDQFGTYCKGLMAANLKPNKITNWTPENTLEGLKKVTKKFSSSPSMRDLKKSNNYDLLNAGLKYFGRYNNFLRAAGLDVVLEMNKWTRSKVIKELQKIQNTLGRTPRRTELASMKRYDLINAAEKYFPNWSEALIAAGLVPNSDVLNDDKTWREWGDLIFELMSRKNIVFEKKRYIKKVGYPDIYIPSKDKIIEIKLNCSENSVKQDIQKYLPYCKTLEIWYLFGKPFGILSNKVYFVGPNKIKEMIKNEEYLLNRFNKIKNKLEVKPCETKNNKSSCPWEWGTDFKIFKIL